MEKLQNIFAENLKTARNRAGWTQEALAERVGITAKYLSVIERGVKFPTIQVIEALCSTLEIPAFSLFIQNSSLEFALEHRIVSDYNVFILNKIVSELENAKRDYLSKRADSD